MTSSIFGVYHSKLQKKAKWLPSNHLKFDILLAACLIPTEMKFNRCTLVYIPSGGANVLFGIHVDNIIINGNPNLSEIIIVILFVIAVLILIITILTHAKMSGRQ